MSAPLLAPWSVPLHRELTQADRYRAEAYFRARNPQLFVPPWPSLMFSWEAGMLKTNEFKIREIAKWIALGSDRKNSTDETSANYRPPTSVEELMTRLENGEHIFPDARLAGADLRGAALMGCRLLRADLRGADFTGANLYLADLSNSKLNTYERDGWPQPARFTGAILDETTFREADLRDAEDLAFDGNDISGAHFSPRTGSRWLRLMESYTTVTLLINAALLLIFVFPMVVELKIWQAIGAIQSSVHDSGRLAEIRDILSSGYYRPTWLSHLTECLAPVCDTQYTLAYVLFGERTNSLWTLTAIALLIYNALRLALTIGVSRHKEVSQLSGFTPSRSDTDRLWRMHRVNGYLLAITLIPLVWSVWGVAESRIFTPAR